MVVWISASMKYVYDKALHFILYIPSLYWRSNEALYLEMCFAILMPSYMVPAWSYLSSSLPPLPIMYWIFRTSPLKVSWYSHSWIFSSWSQWYHLRNQAVVSSPLLIYYGAGSVKVTVRCVILTTPPFDLLMPSDNIIDNLWASTSRTWNIFSHHPRVYDNSGRTSKL